MILARHEIKLQLSAGPDEKLTATAGADFPSSRLYGNFGHEIVLPPVAALRLRPARDEIVFEIY